MFTNAVIFCLWTCTARSDAATQTTFTFDDIYDAQYRPKIFSLEWVKGTESFLFRNKANDVIKYNATDDTQEVFLPTTLFVELKAEKFFVSSDQKLALFAYQVKQIWRHSFTAKYLILDMETKNRYYFPSGQLQNESLSYVAWAPIGYSLVFIYKNNVYIQNGPSASPKQFTQDGNATVINGIPDWLYEEEILEAGFATSWSPNGHLIFYSKFDITDIPRQNLLYYGRPDNLYGRLKGIHYPKAGYTVNGKPGPTTKVKLFVTNIENNYTLQLVPPSPLLGKDHYYIGAAWRDSNHILVTWTSRVQNKSVTILYGVDSSSEAMEVLTTVERNGWIEVPNPEPQFLDNGERYLTIHPHKPSSRRQLAIVTCKANVKDEIVYLTSGEEVETIVGVNRKAGYVYYIAIYHTKGRQLWRIRIPSPTTMPSSAPRQHRAECMHRRGAVAYVEASFSSSGENFLIQIMGPDVPQFFLRSTAEGREHKSLIMEDNSALINKLKDKLLPTKEYFTFQIGDGSVGFGQMLVPPNPRKNEIFPMLVFTYAGPGTQAVTTKFILDRPLNNWLVHMASEHRVLVVSTDGRGSMANGNDLKFAIYKRIGTVEIEDQLLGAEFIKKHSALKVAAQSAIFGWSYGGFAAAHALANKSETFSCAVSVAPTTNKGFYDTAYSERYLGLVTDPGGPAIYNRTSLLNKVELFRGKKFFIAQGLADDNVNYNHFAHLVRELQKHLILFRQSTYPEEKHHLATTEINKHLFLSISDFLLNECWSNRGSNSNDEVLEQFFHSLHALLKTFLPL